MMLMGASIHGGKRRARWMAGLMISTALVGAGFKVEAQQAAPAPLPAAGAQQHSFRIASQSLTDGLTQFGQQSGWQVSVQGSMIQGVSTPGVTGTSNPRAAWIVGSTLVKM